MPVVLSRSKVGGCDKPVSNDPRVIDAVTVSSIPSDNASDSRSPCVFSKASTGPSVDPGPLPSTRPDAWFAGSSTGVLEIAASVMVGLSDGAESTVLLTALNPLVK